MSISEKAKKRRSFRVSERRRKLKEMAVAYKGGKCCKCGYDKCLGALDFHHRDSNTKSFGISSKGLTYSFEKVKAELEKCILVCKNCHAEIHAKEYLIEHSSNYKLVKCLNCKVEIKVFEQKKANLAFCGYVCRNEYFKNIPEKIKSKDRIKRRKTIWPNKEELSKLLWQKPTTQIAKEYGVSDKAIEKWAKKYGLKKPVRGYWQKHKKNIHP